MNPQNKVQLQAGKPLPKYSEVSEQLTENSEKVFTPSIYDSGPGVKKYTETDFWANIKDQYMLQPIYGGEGRILVKIDEYKSKYACTACNGRGHTDDLCPSCNGTKFCFDGIAKSPCKTCAVGESDGIRRYGYRLCPQCHGKQGTIIVPDVSQKMSDSGDVLAVSRTGINILKPGMKVLIATYTGVPFRFLDIDFRMLVEKDVLGILRQLKKTTENINQDSFADLENLGVPRE